MSENQDNHILLVEDSLTQASLAENILTKAGYEVTIRENGEEALKFLENGKVNIIISDIVMPVMDGFTLCQNVKSNRYLKKIPFILLTSLTDLKSIIYSLNCGADNYLNKPIDEEILLSTIKSMISEDLIYDDPVFSRNINLNEEEFTINSKPSRILNLLLTLFSDISNKNNELIGVNDNLQSAREQLKKTNNELETKLFELKISEEKFRSLVSTIPDIVYKIDTDGLFTFVNNAVKKIGYLPEELIGKHFSCIMIPEQVDKTSRKKVIAKFKEADSSSIDIPQLFDEQRTGDRKTTGLEITMVTKNGNHLKPLMTQKLGKYIAVAEVNASGIFEKELDGPDKKFIGTVGVIHDISQHKVLENQLETAREEAEKANDFKSQFLANMSHEIRTPMNAIIGLSYLLEQTVLNKKQQDFLSKINISAKNLLKIINSILDFSKIEAGMLEMENIDFNLHEVISELKDTVAVKTEAKNLELIFDIDNNVPGSLFGDSLHLHQVLINLVNNSIKFTEEGEITVQIRSTEKTENSAVLEFAVIDSGIGISEDKINDLFKPFNQADISTTRKFGGTGLGLGISKHLIELMSGTIEVESKLSHGSTFRFTAEFGLDKTRKDGNYYSLFPEKLNHLNILITDHNVKVGAVLSKMINNFKFNSVVSLSGFEAIEILQKKQNIDLIIIELNMPGMNGLDTIKNIVKDKKIKNKPKIILITGYKIHLVNKQINNPNIKKYFNPENILQKPITPSMLFDSIINIFNTEIEKEKSNKRYKKTSKLIYSGKSLKILLVEDNEINQDVVVGLLEEHNFKVDVSNNGKEAVEVILSNIENKYDLVLMDLQMPIMDGYEATRVIREKYKKIPIIAMTADAIKGIEERVISLGMNGYISKPVNPKELVETLLQYTENKNPWSRAPGDLCSDRMRQVAKNAQPSSPEQAPRYSGPPNKKKHKDNFDSKIIPEKKDKKSLSSLKHIDTEKGLKLVMNNKKLYYKVLSKFIDQKKDMYPKIKSHIVNKNYSEANFLVHSLKGVSGTIGADTLFEYLSEANVMLNNENIDYGEINDSISKIEAEINNVLNDINSLNIEYEI